MIALLLTLAGSYAAGRRIGNAWAAAAAGLGIGLASGVVGGLIVGAMGGGLFSPGEVATHVVGGAALQAVVGVAATLAFRARAGRASRAAPRGGLTRGRATGRRRG